MRSIVIIGNSITSLGALNFLLENKDCNFEILHIIDDRNTKINYKDSNSLNRYLGKLGTSKYWHAVSPLEPKSDRSFNKLFKQLYGFHPNVNSSQLFTPLIRPSSARSIKFYRKEFIKKKVKYKTIHSRVKNILIEENQKQKFIILNNEKKIGVDSIIFAINPLDIIDILDLDKNQIQLYDQIHTFHGIINTKKNKTQLNTKLKRNIYGYFYDYYKKNKYLFYLKPFYGDFNNFAFQQNLAKSRFEIYKDIFLSPQVNSKLNALYSRFGIKFPTVFYGLWSQQIVKREYCYDQELGVYLPNFNFEKNEEVFCEDMKLIENEINLIIPGNHFFLVMKKQTYDSYISKNIFFSTIKSNLDCFDGRHPTLLLSNYLYKELDKNLKSFLNKG